MYIVQYNRVIRFFLLHMKYGIGQWMCTENLKLIFKKQFWYFQVFFADMELWGANFV